MPYHPNDGARTPDINAQMYAKRGLHLVSNYPSDRRAEIEFVVKHNSDLGVSIEDDAFNRDGTPYETAFALVMPLEKRDDVGLWWARYDTYRDEWIRHHQE